MALLKHFRWAVIPICLGVITTCAASKPQPQTQPSAIAQAKYTTGQNGYRWANVSIGGGGFVTGVYPHPRQQDLVYIRTDVGGFYRWNPTDKSWMQLNNSFPVSKENYYGGEALAVDPNNPNTVYIAAGKYPKLPLKGTIFKSADAGKTWTKLNIDLAMGGNEDHRWAGIRLAVNPANSNIIFFGSRYDGLWKSADAGATWAKVTSFSPSLTEGVGILGIVFDKRSPGLVYANVYGDGIYKSTDTGVTWQKIEGSPKQGQRIAVANNGILYVTHQSGVSKYSNGTWGNITPNSKEASFNALAVNPSNPNDVIVALGQSVSTKIYRTSDGGTSWTEMKVSLKHTVPWWDDYMFSVWTSAIEFDPKVPSRVWLTDGNGIWQTENINANPVIWTNYEAGHEELVVFSLAAPPKGGVLLSGTADQDGFYHNNGLNAYPSTRLAGISQWSHTNRDTFSIAYSESDPLRVVRVGGARWNSNFTGATSTDGGLTWQKFPSFPANTMPLRLALSANNPNLFVVAVSEGKAIRTTDGGASWSAVSGLPNGPKGPWYWGEPLAADKVDGNTFYYYSDGKVYRSNDGGASFSLVNSSVPKSEWVLDKLKTVPGAKGEVWLSLEWNGLFRSTDGGNTFTKLPSVESARLFAFGKPPTGSTTPALYVYGKVAGVGEGIFRSLDKGQTWTSIGSQQNPIGNGPVVMEASWQQYGLVFIGTAGNGIYYGSPGS
ncbi:WD40/YVTN/BNR-like repeat-containing protein [Aerosakkonema funiforme]|uniref:WD40/YVTN/BNR-like repeat-containing protein n=1 Tax=Aerosakkonema funiforme TaxID=1246630 RepID=UPI0035BB14A1